MVENPLVTVLMPVYNSEKYLSEAINSILNQSYTNFELLIINDNSLDSSDEIISGFSDDRIISIRNESNLGLVKTLNKGIKISKGKYIARMDGDDISLAERFSEQVKHLEENEKVGVCGSDFEVFDQYKISGIVKCIPDDEHIRCAMLFYCPMAHPSVMMRSVTLKNNNLFYDDDYKYSEDYEFWNRLSMKTEFANISNVLLRYRIHEKQISTEHSVAQQEGSDRIRRAILDQYDIKFSDNELQLHNNFGRSYFFTNSITMLKTEKWLINLIRENATRNFLPQSALKEIICSRWKSFVSSSNLGFLPAIHFVFSPLTWIVIRDIPGVLKITVKSVLKRR